MADITATIGGSNSSGPSKVSVTTPSASASTTFASLTDVSVASVSDQDLIQFVSCHLINMFWSGLNYNLILNHSEKSKFT